MGIVSHSSTSDKTKNDPGETKEQEKRCRRSMGAGDIPGREKPPNSLENGK